MNTSTYHDSHAGDAVYVAAVYYFNFSVELS